MRKACVLLALGLAGCNAVASQRPEVRAVALPSFDTALQQHGSDLKQARQHRMTHVQAANRLRVGAHATPGADFSDADEALINHIAVLSAEIHPHRMNPEMMGYKIQERVAQNDADERQVADDQHRIRAVNALQNFRTLQAIRNLQRAPASVPDPPAYQMPLMPMSPVRLQTTCISQQLGAFTNTMCD